MQASYCATRLNAATDSAKRVRCRQRAVVGIQLLDDAGVLRRIGRHRDAREILRRRAQHRRTADVDVLDDLVHRGVGSGRHLLERIQVEHQQVDRRDAVFGHHRVVDARAPEQAAVDHRMQRLDAAVHHFREAGDVADVPDLQAGVAQRLGGAAGGQQFDAGRGECAREVDKTGLVGNGQQRAAHAKTIGGHAGIRRAEGGEL